MAERRMFSKTVINSARFLRMPPTSRLLYYDLGMSADDDGIVEAFTVMRTTGATEDDLRVLVSKGFVTVLNDDLVTYICDWSKNNFIRKDRYSPSIYSGLLVGLFGGQPVVNQTTTNGRPRIGKDRLGEERVGEERTVESPAGEPPARSRFVPPSEEEDQDLIPVIFERDQEERYSNGNSNVTVTVSPPSPPSSPFLPPSPFPPEPPLSSSPYNPPSPSPTTRRTGARSQEDFDLFWSAYPKKVGKKSAKKAFDKVQVPVETLVTAIRRQECSAQWSKDGGQFIPNPSTWLNQERWEDELDPIPGQEQSPVPPPKKYETRLIDGEWVDVEVKESTEAQEIE